MTNDDYAGFAELWLATCGLYPHGRQPNEATVSIAFEALSAYPLTDIRRALSAHLQDPDAGRFQPTPAAVLAHLAGTGTDRARLAWSKVEKAMRSVGQYQTVAFDDPLIHEALAEMDSWPRLCQTSEDELPFRRQEFIKRYEARTRMGASGAHPPALVGTDESECRMEGYLDRVPETVLIGDQQQAQQVLESGKAGQRIEIGYNSGLKGIGQAVEQIGHE